jgi:hypothetical protein
VNFVIFAAKKLIQLANCIVIRGTMKYNFLSLLKKFNNMVVIIMHEMIAKP